jgi:2-keto-4-pentenoate hydratase/2-oxohepta-3-ene-1,7-dioic acid hydratase in catechol pathway
MDYVFGFTVANDVSARDLQLGTASGSAARASTRSAPSCRRLCRGEVHDPHDLHVVQRVNGTVMQDGSSKLTNPVVG